MVSEASFRRTLRDNRTYYQLTDENPAYCAAMLLRPSRRMTHVKKNWPRSLQLRLSQSHTQILKLRPSRILRQG